MIFVDTGPFLAHYLDTDQHHEEALLGWGHLTESEEGLATSSFVLDELFTLLGRRSSYSFAAARARELLASPHLRILRPDEQAEREALEDFEKYADQKVSFTDCISFALLRRHRITRVFTFDRHFWHAGFQIWPTPL